MSCYHVHHFNTAPGHVISFPEIIEAAQGKSVNISITGGAVPPITKIVWKKDGSTLSNSERIQGANTFTLRINEANLYDIGLYQCIPSNEDGSFNSSVTQVNIRSKWASDGEQHDSNACNLHFLYSPSAT